MTLIIIILHFVKVELKIFSIETLYPTWTPASNVYRSEYFFLPALEFPFS